MLTITRGIPASGKTTWIHKVSEVVVSRDDIRRTVFGASKSVLAPEDEATVTRIEESQVRELLRAGHDVVVADMNLRERYVKRWYTIAQEEGVVFEVKDFPVDLDEALYRNELRHWDERVPESLIRDLHKRFTPFKPLYKMDLPLPVLAEKYVAPKDAPKAIIVDIDGTVAKMNGRGPHDYDRVGEDLPNLPVIGVVEKMSEEYYVIFCSGRPDTVMWETRDWLEEHLPTATHTRFVLLMRKEGDYRNDAIVKREIFDRYIRDYYDVQCVWDDRQRVVDMWRSLGLTVFQVDKGDF